jgi:flagellar basal-body rod protein FlgF
VQQSLYVGLSAQRTLQQRLDTIAQNVANQRTPGYLAEDVTFRTAVSERMSDPVAFAAIGAQTTSLRRGEVKATGQALDVAVNGDGWLGVQTAKGLAVTRDGRLRMTAEGNLQTATGLAVLDAGGTPARVDPAAGPIVIEKSGTILQNGRPTGTLGLFLVPKDAVLERGDAGTLIPSVAPIASAAPNGVSLLQGHLEGSNVEPMQEMTRLIAVHRTFDAVSAALTRSEETLVDAIRTLGGTS